MAALAIKHNIVVCVSYPEAAPTGAGYHIGMYLEAMSGGGVVVVVGGAVVAALAAVVVVVVAAMVVVVAAAAAAAAVMVVVVVVVVAAAAAVVVVVVVAVVMGVGVVVVVVAVVMGVGVGVSTAHFAPRVADVLTSRASPQGVCFSRLPAASSPPPPDTPHPAVSVFGSTGERVHHYRKAHLWSDYEAATFVPGDAPPSCFTLKVSRGSAPAAMAALWWACVARDVAGGVRCVMVGAASSG